jgi:hypothetical protein
MHDYVSTTPYGIQKIWPITVQTEQRPTTLRNLTVQIYSSQESQGTTYDYSSIQPNSHETTNIPERFLDLVNTGTEDDTVVKFQMNFKNPEENGTFETDPITASPSGTGSLDALEITAGIEDIGMIDMPVELIVAATGPCAGGWEGEFAGAWEGVANVDGTAAGNAGPGVIDITGTLEGSTESADITVPNYQVESIKGSWTRPEVMSAIEPPENYRNRIREPSYQEETTKTSYTETKNGITTYTNHDPCRWALGIAPNFHYLPVPYRNLEEAGFFYNSGFIQDWQTIDCQIADQQNVLKLGPFPSITVPKTGILYLILESYNQQPRQKNYSVNVKVQFY